MNDKSRKLELLKTLLKADDETKRDILSFLKRAVQAYEKSLTSKVDSALARLRNGRDGKHGRDGKDGRHGRDGKDGINGFDGKDGQDGSPDTAEQVRDKLESLEGDERIDVSAIKGLEEKIKVGVKAGGGGSAVAFQTIHTPTHEQFTMDGVATSVTLANAPSANGKAAWVHYNGQFLANGNTYTTDGNKINFTFTPEADTTVEVVYIP